VAGSGAKNRALSVFGGCNFSPIFLGLLTDASTWVATPRGFEPLISTVTGWHVVFPSRSVESPPPSAVLSSLDLLHFSSQAQNGARLAAAAPKRPIGLLY